MKKVTVILWIFFITLLSSCTSQKSTVLIVTTTSLDNSGLLEYILPFFEEEYDCKVDVVALGTGAALALGKEGEADILLVHDPVKELEFIENGFGERRKDIMYNDFVFVGPSRLDASSLEDALSIIANGLLFYSRGDNSGTHSKEMSLWEEHDYDVSMFGDWYQETGQSMGSTLMMASLKEGYTFTDRSTFLAMQDELTIDIVYENTEELKNMYGIIKVSPSLHQRDTMLTDAFYEWISQESTKEIIESYQKNNTQLFFTLSEE